MAQQIKLKRSAVAGRIPTTSSLDLGEIAVNTADGKLYFQRGDSTIQSFFTTNALTTGSLQQSGSDSYFLSNVGIGTTSPVYALDVNADNIRVGVHTIGIAGSATTGSLAIGQDALGSYTGNYSNTAIGWKALSLVTGGPNDAIGAEAMRYSIGATYNTAIGLAAGYRSQGTQNTFIGQYSGPFYSDVTGGYNTFIGPLVGLFSSGSSQRNTGIGANALYSFTNADSNTALGSTAGFDLTTGGSNTFIGDAAGRGVTTGTGNTVIGRISGLSSTLSGTVIIGDGNGNQRIYVDNTGNVGIGTTSPAERLDVSGSIKLDSKLIVDGVEVANPTPSTDQVRLSGYGMIGNRGTLYITNAWSGGSVQIGNGSTHSADQTAHFRSNAVLFERNVGINRGDTTPPESLTVEGNISASGDLYLDGAIFDSNDTSGSLGQVLTSIAGGTAWEDIDTAVLDEVENIYATVKNVSGGTLFKGTPVHAVSGSSSGNVNPVIAASASDATTMPATFILNQDINDEAEGQAIIAGHIEGVDTSLFNVGDIVYVGESGGYTNVKPTGSGNLIQNLGVVTKVHASNGSGVIYGSGRSNDVPNLPVGKIWVGSDSYSVTSSLVHLDETNGRLGIGTTTPQRLLDVNGDVRVKRNIYGADGSYIGFFADGGGAIPLKGRSLALTTNFNNNAPTNGLYVQGDAGIGVTNPGDFNSAATNLVVGTGAGSNGITVYSGTSSAGGIYFADESGSGAGNRDGVINYNHSSATMDFKTGGNQRLLSLNTGTSTFNLGDVVMENNLTVKGIVTAQEFHTEFVSASIIYQSGSTQFGNDANDTHIFSGSLTQHTSATRYIKLRGGSGDLQVVSDNNTTPVAYIKGTGTADLLNVFDNTTEVFTILDGGNVGIGTTSPSQKLHVNGNGRFSGDIYINGQILRSDSTGTKIGFDNNVIRLHTNTSERMRIDSAGNVGIGTTSPSQKLQVDGSIYSNGGNVYINGNKSFVAVGNMKFETYYNSAYGERMRLTEDGKVGIGTTSPSYKLTVGDSSGGDGTTAGIAGFYGQHASSPGLLQINYDTDGSGETSVKFGGNGMITGRGGIFNFNTSGKDISFAVNNEGNANVSNAALYISSSGDAIFQNNVGIGTTSPSVKLHVSDATAPSFRLSRTGTGQIWEQGIDSSGRFQLKEAASEGGTQYTRLQVDDTGEVQFGAYGSGTITGTAAYTLAIDSSGNIIEVDTSNINAGENTDVDTGTEVVDTFSSGSGASAFTNYVVNDGTNYRAGQLMTVWNTAGSIEYTDVSTNSIGDTSEVFIFAAVNGADIEIKATVPSDNWVVRVNSTLL